MTGAKLTVVLVCLTALTAGCADLKRFAPPGIVKYEHIANEKTQNPVIKARIAETKKEGGGAFPDLSMQPKKAPAPMPAGEQEKLITALRAGGAALEADVAASRDAAETADGQSVVLPGGNAQTGSLDEAREALDEAVRKDEDAARKERRDMPTPAPIPPSQ